MLKAGKPKSHRHTEKMMASESTNDNDDALAAVEAEDAKSRC